MNIETKELIVLGLFALFVLFVYLRWIRRGRTYDLRKKVDGIPLIYEVENEKGGIQRFVVNLKDSKLDE